MNNKSEHISFEWHSLAKDVIYNLWVIVLAFLIGRMGAGIWSAYFYKPAYTSTATLIVNMNTSGSQAVSLSTSSEIAGIFVNIFTEPLMTERAEADYAENDGADFTGRITSSLLPSTNIFTVSVTDDSPMKAYRELSSVLRVYPEVLDSVFSDVVIDVMRSPDMPRSASNSSSSFSGRTASIACALAALAAIVLISLNRDTIKDEWAYREKTDAKLFGTVPHEKKKLTLRGKSKAPLLIDRAASSFEFTESYSKLAAKLEYMHRSEDAQVFMFTSIAENEGKSTIAANTAIALAKNRSRVLLLDMDLKKPALGKLLDLSLTERNDIGALLTGKIRTKDYKLVKYKRTSLYIAPSVGDHRDFDGFGGDFGKEIFSAFRRAFDYIIIDTSPISASADVTELSHLSDKTILVVRTDTVYAADVNDAVLSLESRGENSFAGCVLNDVWGEFSLFGQLGSDERGYYGYGYRAKNYAYSKYSSYADDDSFIEPDLSSVRDPENKNGDE